MTDEERLDALEKYGLCLAQHQTLTHTGWDITWVCVVGDHAIVGPAIRDVIDTAVDFCHSQLPKVH